MRFWLLLISCFIAGGCMSAERAQNSLESGLHHNHQARQALFNKAWGLNRALNNEARQKRLAHAKIDILKLSKDGKIGVEEAQLILQHFEKKIMEDEIVISKNFAYLVFVLTNGERADQYLSQVDYYLEKNKPIWYHLYKMFFGKPDVVEDNYELENWRQLTNNIDK